jgi:hypothetical protein
MTAPRLREIIGYGSYRDIVKHLEAIRAEAGEAVPPEDSDPPSDPEPLDPAETLHPSLDLFPSRKGRNQPMRLWQASPALTGGI